VTRHRPLGLIPASVNTHQDWTLKVATTELLNQPVPADPSTRTVLDFINNRPNSFSWAITEVNLDDNGFAIATALLQGTAIAVSDGSFKDNQGTSAFIIEGKSEVGRLVGVNIIPGETESQSPYHSELGGVAGVLEALNGI
jgi:hypothetical protein